VFPYEYNLLLQLTLMKTIGISNH